MFVVLGAAVGNVQSDSDNRCDDRDERGKQLEEENATSLTQNLEPRSCEPRPERTPEHESGTEKREG
jgi:hypothetical protein